MKIKINRRGVGYKLTANFLSSLFAFGILIGLASLLSGWFGWDYTNTLLGVFIFWSMLKV